MIVDTDRILKDVELLLEKLKRLEESTRVMVTPEIRENTEIIGENHEITSETNA